MAALETVGDGVLKMRDVLRIKMLEARVKLLEIQVHQIIEINRAFSLQLVEKNENGG